MKYLSTILILLTLNIFSQVKDSENELNYFPLKVGNTWEFTNPSNEWSQEISVKSYTNDKYEVTTKNYLGNLSPVTTVEILEYRNNMLLVSAGGGGMFNSKVEQYSEKPIKLKIPLTENQSWSYDIKGKKYDAKVLKKHKSIETPYGVFDDVVEIQEKLNDAGFVAFKFYYYAKNVGLIKTEIADTEKGKRDVFLYLKKYKVS
jgi:hypothetical protein